MRLLDTDTRYLDQDSFNIPKLNNEWGAMVLTLDQALVEGTEAQEVLSITTTEDTEYVDKYWITTLVLNSNHGFKKNLSVIKITGSLINSYNGLFRVQDVSSNSIKIAFDKVIIANKPEDISDTTGIQISTAPLGFEVSFESLHKRVYKSRNPKAKQAYLRLDNSCPQNYDPTWAKFSRVSMFSDIDDIEDYSFRLGRYKAPCFESNYDAVELDSNDVWFNTSSSYHAHTFYPRTSSRVRGIPNFFILGDSKTFYVYLQEVLNNDSSYYSDAIYTFGEYTKIMYLEDPLPIILFTATKYDNDNYMLYSPRVSFWHDSTTAKYLFNSDFNFNFTTQKHDNWSFWLSNNYRSGGDTRINFKVYKNELAYNLFPKYVRTHRREGVFLEGCMRGLYDFMSNFKDTPVYTPKHLEIIKTDTLYLTLRLRDYDIQDVSFAAKLADWE